MSEEIKEILKCMKNYGSTTELAILDYITNLQEENERLNNIINEYEEKTQMLDSVCRSLEFSAPENDYIFKERLREIIDKLKDLKEKDNE